MSKIPKNSKFGATIMAKWVVLILHFLHRAQFVKLSESCVSNNCKLGCCVNWGCGLVQLIVEFY